MRGGPCLAAACTGDGTPDCPCERCGVVRPVIVEALGPTWRTQLLLAPKPPVGRPRRSR
jgi:hypothetical protein